MHIISYVFKLERKLMLTHRTNRLRAPTAACSLQAEKMAWSGSVPCTDAACSPHPCETPVWQRIPVTPAWGGIDGRLLGLLASQSSQSPGCRFRETLPQKPQWELSMLVHAFNSSIQEASRGAKGQPVCIASSSSVRDAD